MFIDCHGSGISWGMADGRMTWMVPLTGLEAGHESLYDLEALSPCLFFPVVKMSKEESHEQITDIQLVFSGFLAFISLLLPSLSWVARLIHSFFFLFY